MENIEEGKISEVPKQDTAVVVEQPKETREPRARNTFATFLATIAVLLGAGGLTTADGFIKWYGWKRSKLHGRLNCRRCEQSI